jgi:hypothetical protein
MLSREFAACNRRKSNIHRFFNMPLVSGMFM